MDTIKEFSETEFQNSSHEKDERIDKKQGLSSNQSERSHLKVIKPDKHYLMNDDDEKLTNKKGSVDSDRAGRWRIAAVVVSWFSIAATLAIGIAEFVVAKSEDSSAAFGLAFDAILDVLTSVVVLWRYYRANDTYSQARESISCVFLGILFLVSSIGVAGKAIFNLINSETLNMTEAGIKFLLTTTSVAAVVCLILFAIKVLIGYKLASWTLFSDAFNSLMGGVIALSMIITTMVTRSNPYLWYLDPTIGLCVGMFLLFYGLWLLVKYVPKLQGTVLYKRTK